MLGIEEDIADLKILGKLDLPAFIQDKKFENANFHLHHALEGVFNISSHLISRVPGAAAAAYRDIALKMGELGFVDKNFAEEALVKMAGYRNRIVHFYSEITPQEYYKIIQNHLGDFDKFLSHIKSVLEHPDTSGLTVE